MGIYNVNILDERHFFEDITFLIALAGSAVDNREGEGVSVLENQECWHGVEFVNFTGDVGKCRAGIGVSLEFDSKKEVGVIDSVINALIFMEGDCLLGMLFDLVSSELEEGSRGCSIRGAVPSLGSCAYACQSLRGML